MSLTNTSWFGNPKDTNQETLKKLSSFLTLNSEVELSVIDDYTNALSVYEYGPALSLLELEVFMESLCQKVSKFRTFREELFYQMFNAICFCDESNFVIKNCCILVLLPPTCVCLKFGPVEQAKFVIHLANHSLYILGNDLEPIPFLKETSTRLHEIYCSLKDKIAIKVGTMMMQKMTKFERCVFSFGQDCVLTWMVVKFSYRRECQEHHQDGRKCEVHRRE